MSELDLVLTRRMAVAPARVWRCWTEPELLKQWFAPKPVETREAVLDLRPGGRFYTLMVLPDGTEIGGDGCVLVVEPERRLVFTDCLGPGFRPNVEPFFTAEITLAPDGDGTFYTARAMHATAERRARHEEMGFHDGWGAAATQLEALADGLGGQGDTR